MLLKVCLFLLICFVPRHIVQSHVDRRIVLHSEEDSLAVLQELAAKVCPHRFVQWIDRVGFFAHMLISKNNYFV